MNEEEVILGAFLLVNDYRTLTNEELEDVKKAINNLQQENVKLKQQSKDKDEKISKVVEIIRNDTTLNPQRQRDRLINILETNKED